MTPVTVIDVQGNEYLQRRTEEIDGYSAVQVGYDDKKDQRVSKPLQGHFKAQGGKSKYLVREFRVNAEELPEKGAENPGAALYQKDQWVDVIGTTKGKGFQGVVKRHGFAGQRMTHGSMMHRRPGGIGGCAWPGRVWKGKEMPGRDGGARRTVQNLKIVETRPEDGVILVSGCVPGSRGSYVIVRPAKKKPAAAKA